MREFSDVQRELGLQKFLASPLGTLYFVPSAPGSPRVIVRHFDGELAPELVPAYADLVRATQEWVERRPELAELIRVEQPTEVGTDFVARPHHTYGTSIDAYEEWEDPPQPPPELDRMRRALREALEGPGDEKEAIVGRALARSLLEPTGKTYFKESEGRFVVVEPKVTREDVERWAALTGVQPRAGSGNTR
jgi:hypothetical protein